MLTTGTAFIWTFLIHGASGGGAYCAKSARARAAALGLDYPGNHGAPDLFAPAPYETPHHPDTYYHPQLHHTEPETHPVDVGRFYDPERTATHPERFDEFIPSHGGGGGGGVPYEPGQVLWIPRGKLVVHVGGDAPGQFDPVQWDPEGLSDPMWFSHGERDLDDDEDDDEDDESASNSDDDVATSVIFLPLQKSPKAFQRGVATRYGRRRKDRRVKKAKSRRGSASPSRYAAYLRKSLTVKPLALQGNPVIRLYKAPRKAPLKMTW